MFTIVIDTKQYFSHNTDVKTGTGGIICIKCKICWRMRNAFMIILLMIILMLKLWKALFSPIQCPRIRFLQRLSYPSKIHLSVVDIFFLLQKARSQGRKQEKPVYKSPTELDLHPIEFWEMFYHPEGWNNIMPDLVYDWMLAAQCQRYIQI